MTGPAHDTARQRLILVADDDPDIRAVISSSLEVLGHIVMQATDGTHALQLYREVLPDVVVLDIMMPGLSGIEVCKAIKGELESGEHVPVLMLTARDSIQDKVDGLAIGADDYLTKPFHYQELQGRVSALLRVRDLNERIREKNRELAAMQERLVEQERQLAARQLAGTAAHQLGQPLSAILLNCHLVRALPADDPRAVRALAAIEADARKMAELIEALKSVDASRVAGYYEETTILHVDSSSAGEEKLSSGGLRSSELRKPSS